MNAKRLHYADGTPTDQFVCGQCKQLWNLGYAPVGTGGENGRTEYWPEEKRIQWVSDRAERCCQEVCEQCGEKLPRHKKHFRYCDKCGSAKQQEEYAKKEAAAFLNATAVDGADHKIWHNDRVYDDIGDLLERFECDDEEPPEYVWVAEPMPLTIDADRVLDSALDDHHEDARDHVSADMEEELQAFLDDWCKRTGVVSYTESRKHYVLIPKEQPEPPPAGGESQNHNPGE